MSIIQSEIIWRKSQEMSDFGTNGGRMSHLQSVSDVKNNIWPDVNMSELASGSNKYRKVHIHIANDDDLPLINAKVFVSSPTPGDDSVTIFTGDHTNVQSQLTGTERKYGAGNLNADVTAGATSIAVMTEGAALDYFKAGDTIRISDKTSVTSETGNTEYATIAAGGVSYAGDVATLTLDAALVNSFSAANTRVASVIEAGTVQGTVSGFTVTSAGGTFNNTDYPIVVDSIGGIRQNWTLTFTTATAFNLTGDVVGNIGSGNVGSNLQPVNPNLSKPYFVLPTAGWGGTFTAGDTVTFTTSPATIPLWYNRIIPAGANSLAGNSVVVGVEGESA